MLRDIGLPADKYCRQGYNNPSHDIFTLEVLLRMSDLTETANNTKWNVRLGVNSGEVISVASREVTVSRVSSDTDRKISERPVINLSLQLKEAKVYRQGEQVEMTGVLQHLDISHGEAGHNNTKLRLIYPSWLSWVDASDTCKTNYTSGSSEDCKVAALEDEGETKY